MTTEKGKGMHVLYRLWGVTVTACLLLVLSSFVFHNYIENTSSVWINESPPINTTEVITTNDAFIITEWQGYRRRDCDEVTWNRVFKEADSGAVVHKEEVSATSARRTNSGEEPKVYKIRIPYFIPEGQYTVDFVEEAKCNAFKTWRNPVGSVSFTRKAPK